MNVLWCPPEWRGWGGTYWLKPIGFYRGRIGGKATLDICIGFVWSGFWVIELGGVKDDETCVNATEKREDSR